MSTRRLCGRSGLSYSFLTIFRKLDCLLFVMLVRHKEIDDVIVRCTDRSASRFYSECSNLE